MPISAAKTKVLRKRAKRHEGPILNKVIDSACEKWLRERGLATRKFAGWQRYATAEEGQRLIELANPGRGKGVTDGILSLP